MVVLTEFILSLALLLIVALIGGLAFRRFGYPVALDELLIGSVIGPYALGLVGRTEILIVFAELGAIVLLFYIGLETELEELASQVVSSISVGISGALLPFILGYLSGTLFKRNPHSPPNCPPP